MSGDKFYRTDSPAQLIARTTNYEEGMADALKLLENNTAPEVIEACQMLQAIMQASGNDHLAALRGFEESTAAIIAFKNRVLESLCSEGCPLCGGTTTHAPDCLVATALRVHPHTLPQVEPPAIHALSVLRLKLALLVDKLGEDDTLRDELIGLLKESQVSVEVPAGSN
jgi:hypothetical protein